MTDNTFDNEFEAAEPQPDTSRQVIATGIIWNKKPREQYHSYRDTAFDDLPDSFTFDLPEDVYDRVKRAKSQDAANDILETFTYNFLTKKFNHEVFSCTPWPQF